MQPALSPELSPAEWLPKGRLSWSQIESVLYDPKQYYQRYFLQLQGEPSDDLDLGKVFHDLWKDSKDPSKSKLPHHLADKYRYSFEHLKPQAILPNQETQFSCTFRTKYGPVDFIGFFDGIEFEEKKIVYEMKTSRFRLWDQKKLEGHGQLKLYALVYWKIYGVIPEIELRSFKLDPDPKKCKVVVRKYQPTMQDILLIQNKMELALDYIYQLYVAHQVKLLSK